MPLWLIGLGAVMALMFIGLPIAFSMGLAGTLGVAQMLGWAPALAMVGQVAFETVKTYELSVVPLFILMGNFVTRAGFSDELYAAAYAWLGHRRGGLAMSTIVACAGFSSVCGSSLATAATMAKVAMPSMRRYGYAESLAAGSIASGGTLGILIPPSVVLVIYGLIASQDIGKLFIAGILPGILGVVGYVLAVAGTTWLRPQLGPPGKRLPLMERIRALRGIWGIALLFLLVIGGIYTGVFTPTEAAGIGAMGAFVFAFLRRRLTFVVLYGVLLETARTTAMMFAVLIGALIFSNFINLAGLPTAMLGWINGLEVSPLTVLLAILAIYLVLGAVLESMSMILLTVPIFFPIVQGLGIDLIWFGILVVVVTEISLITPPVGMNVFVLRAVMPDVPTRTIYAGIVPFLAADVVRLAVLVAFPVITLYLPTLMGS